MKNPILLLINEQIELINKVNSHNIIIPLQNDNLPEEIKISLHGLPVWSEINRKARLFECSNINIYTGAKNITKEFIDKLIPIIDKYGSKERYSQELDNLLEKQKRNGYSRGYILKSKIDNIKALLKTKKLSYFLKEDYNDSESIYVLGNKTPYHLFNFIYNGINLPSVILLNENQDKYSNISISSGKNPSIDDTFEKYEQGGVNIQVELYYKNPIMDLLEESMNLILERIEALDESIFEVIKNSSNIKDEYSELNNKLIDTNSKFNILNKQLAELKKIINK